MNLSQSIVQFIDHLHPLYMHEEVDRVWCARSLTDGTLILPMDKSEGDENGFVTVHWQGDADRSTVVQGVFMASLAVARYVELHHIAETAKATRDEMERLSHHFTVKTGESLAFESPDSELLGMVSKAVGKLGEFAVMELLKKQVGL
ncbi:MAG: hypothetical protein K2Q97_02880 [Burkholderiaceae bacterium]|nr:hypothetical protein [Burkholderiaceae bacterium]